MTTPASGARPLVLVVDDHDGVRAALIELLGDLGADAVGAAGLAEARGVVERLAVDLVLTDAVLADGEQGFELVEEVRGRPDAIDVVVLSGYDEAQLADRARAAGCELWSKPPDLDRLAARLAALHHR